ncbi:MAG: hypothetical protein WDW38_004951 [Sanguina aurantia]
MHVVVLIGPGRDACICAELVDRLSLTPGRVRVKVELDGVLHLPNLTCEVDMGSTSEGRGMSVCLSARMRRTADGTFHRGWLVLADGTLLLVVSKYDHSAMTVEECMGGMSTDCSHGAPSSNSQPACSAGRPSPSSCTGTSGSDLDSEVQGVTVHPSFAVPSISDAVVPLAAARTSSRLETTEQPRIASLKSAAAAAAAEAAAACTAVRTCTQAATLESAVAGSRTAVSTRTDSRAATVRPRAGTLGGLAGRAQTSIANGTRRVTQLRAHPSAAPSKRARVGATPSTGTSAGVGDSGEGAALAALAAQQEPLHTLHAAGTPEAVALIEQGAGWEGVSDQHARLPAICSELRQLLDVVLVARERFTSTQREQLAPDWNMAALVGRHGFLRVCRPAVVLERGTLLVMGVFLDGTVLRELPSLASRLPQLHKTLVRRMNPSTVRKGLYLYGYRFSTSHNRLSQNHLMLQAGYHCCTSLKNAVELWYDEAEKASIVGVPSDICKLEAKVAPAAAYRMDHAVKSCHPGISLGVSIEDCPAHAVGASVGYASLLHCDNKKKSHQHMPETILYNSAGVPEGSGYCFAIGRRARAV